ncbi:MAG: hypothetical protein IPN68_09790 [Bacteroidetes bacterium]|nr:hypothetical protein [Bacteroidota bacterium]
MNLFVGEMSSGFSRMVLLAETTDQDGVVKNILFAREMMLQDGSFRWTMSADPNFCSDAPVNIKKESFLLWKITTSLVDGDLVREYNDALKRIRLKRANLVSPDMMHDSRLK